MSIRILTLYKSENYRWTWANPNLFLIQIAERNPWSADSIHQDIHQETREIREDLNWRPFWAKTRLIVDIEDMVLIDAGYKTTEKDVTCSYLLREVKDNFIKRLKSNNELLLTYQADSYQVVFTDKNNLIGMIKEEIISPFRNKIGEERVLINGEFSELFSFK